MKHISGYPRSCVSPAPLLIVLIAALLSMAACLPPTGDSASSGSRPSEPGSLELVMEAGARTILPADDSAYTITTFRVTGAGPDGWSYSSDPFTGTSFRITGLAAGGWDMTVNGYNAGGHLVASTAFHTSISASVTSVATIVLARVAGNGSVDVTVNWEVASDYDAVTGSLTPAGGAAENLTLTITGGKSVHYLATKPAGDYVISVLLKKSGLVKESFTEAVQVYEGYTSAKTLDRSISHLPSTFAYNAAWPVSQVDFGGLPSKTLTVTGAAGHSLYLVKSNQAAAAATAATTGSASSVLELTPYSRSLKESLPDEIYDPGQPFRTGNAEADAFNANPPPMLRDSGAGARSGADSPPSCTIGYGPKDPAFTVDVSHKEYWVQNSGGTWIQPRATLRAVGNYCYIWVADTNFDNASAANNDNKITSIQAAALRDKFDGTAANSWKNGIFLNVSTIFGNEYGGGAGGSGGKDDDQHISILVYDISGDYSSTQTGGIYGYFWGKDYYSQANLDISYAPDPAPKTNLAEIFYVDAHFTDRDRDGILSTLAHEYQHMIHFNEKSIVHYPISEPAWLNELCSMAAEDLVCRNIGLDPFTDGAIPRLNAFAYHYPESGVTDWLSGSNTLKSYASAFAFGAYLERNYGGASLFRSILSNDKIGEAAVSAALASEGYTDDFTAAFSHYGEALLFSDKPAGSALKTLKQAWSESLGGITYVAESIDLATIQQRNLDTSSWISGAFGLRAIDPATTVDLRPYGNSIHTRPAWNSLAGDLSITLSAPSDPDVKFYLMIK